MKKLSLALITGGALCAFGVLLGGAALAMTGFEFSKVVTTMKYENKTAAYEPSLLAGIEIAAEDLKVVVSPSPDEQVHLSYWESALDATTIEVDGGMLRFRHTVSDSWLDNFIHGFWSSFARYRHVIEIKIPASFAGSLSVTNENAALEASGLAALSSAAFRSKNGSLELTDILCLGGLTAETTNAPLSLDRVRGGTARITNTNARIRVSDTQLLDTVLQTDNGSVLLHNLTVRSLTAKNKNASLEAEALAAVGRVELETTNASLTAIDVQSAGDLSLRSKNGSVRATNCSASAFFAGTTNAKVDLARCKAAQVQAETSNGSVEIDRLDSRDITLISSNGGIRGSVLGQEADYVIAALTTNGSNNLTDRVGDLPGRLTVRTTNASIHVTFTE